MYELVKRLPKDDRVGASAKNEVQGIGKLIDQFFNVAGFKAAREWATILFVLVRSEIDVIANEIGKLRVIIDGPVLDQAPVSVARRRSVPPALTLDRLA